MVFPLPVGPVTRTIPYGAFTPFMNSPRASSGKPSCLRSNSRLPLSSIRRTIFSPLTVGTQLTRKSMVLSSTLAFMRPSCVLRLSAMFMPAKILRRLRIAGCMALGSLFTWKQVPSLR